MPLRHRLLALVALVLALCLAAGGALTYWTGLRKIELEMSSAIEVGASSVSDALSGLNESTDPSAQLQRVISSFDGDRHVIARLVAPDGTVTQASRLMTPPDPAPAWLYALLAGPVHQRTFELPSSFKHFGTVRIEADPHNEVGEVWEDLKLKILIVSAFCVMV